jgi:uncharacterized hydrophobic protein (TIGR00271 family)
MAESWGSMADYVKRALFVYGEDRKELVERVAENRYGVDIAALPVADFLAEPALHLPGVAHVVVAAALPQVKAVVLLAETHGLSVGFLAPKGQKVLRDAYKLPVDQPAQIELALRDGAPVVDLATCNGEVVMLRGVVGRLPLVDAALHRSWIQILLQGLGGLFGLKLRELRVETAGGRTIRTAACGCTLVQRFDRMRASRFLVRSNSLTDGMISLLIVAPMSVLNYLQSLMSLLIGKSDHARMPPTMGFMRSSSLKISGAAPFAVVLDGVRSEVEALTCVVRPKAVRLNIGGAVLAGGDDPKELDELVEVGNLPAGKELAKAKDGTIPFFSYASEARFRDLFIALREDARISGTYLILMVLSALLATVGLFLSSASVVIGAMLLAPLMAPIMSLSMGLVRQDDRLAFRSLLKIAIGIVIALGAAALFSLLITHKPVTAEMNARLNPSLLDLIVAILAGMAGAYTKSFKEILQSLAGVAIAVALVPPLAVAGIGLGRADPGFFAQAFLLFLTNLTGITVAAALTFRVLGYSPAVRNRRGMAFAFMMLMAVSIPLHFSYKTIVTAETLESTWRSERFLVGGKYLIVEKAELREMRDQNVLYVDVLAREPLTRLDLAQFKEKVQMYFSKRLVVRVSITYIL